MTLHTQLATMLTMTLGGIYVGMALETHERFKKYWQKSYLVSLILEVLFWLMQTVVLYVILYNVNSGELRLYVFLACILGVSIYHVLFKKIYKHLLEAIIKLLNGLIVIPTIWLSRLIFRLIVNCLRLIKGIIKFIFLVVLFPFKVMLAICKKIIPKKMYKKISQTYSFCSTIVNNYKNRTK